jgi:hypothetical protein
MEGLMTKQRLAEISGLSVLFLLACGPAPDELLAGPGGSAELTQALLGANALTPNGLNPNGLSPNGLSPNGLSPNGLSPNSLSPAALAAIQDPAPIGHLSRMLLRYAVACAFDPTQSFAFSWTDSYGVRHDETYRGYLAVSPAWATQPLGREGQQKVSACLGALTNYYGVSVMVSLRSLEEPLKTLTGSPELTQYSFIEGAFFGNLFEATPRLYACYNDANIDHSRAALRDCAVGHVSTTDGSLENCGLIQRLGSCSRHCQKVNGAGQYYPACVDPVTRTSTKAVLTTALP